MSEPPYEAVVLSDLHIGDNTKTCWYQASLHEKALVAVLKWIIARQTSVLEVILLGDLTSLHMALNEGIDPGPAPALDEIKFALKEG